MRFLVYGATHGRGDGIGRKVAASLVQRGNEVLAFCRDPAKAESQTIFPLEAIHLRSEAGQSRLKEAITQFDPDLIWSACGCGFGEPLWQLSEAQISDMVDANVQNNIAMCRTCAPSCIDGGPHLVLTGSVAGVLSDWGAAVYSGTKGFLVPFVRAQRNEYKRQGHNAKLSLVLLSAVKFTGIDVVTDTLELIARHSRSMEILIS